MIKILSPSKNRKVECPNCGAMLQYEQFDVQHDPGMGPERDFIVCPECSWEIVLAAPAVGASVNREHPGAGVVADWTGTKRPAEWGDEPDRLEWWASHGLPCLLLRDSAGTWRGYVEVSRILGDRSDGHVAIPADHAKRLTVDGGVTHNGALGDSTGNWVGCHLTGGTYRTMASCQREVESLAEQLAVQATLVDWDL